MKSDNSEGSIRILHLLTHLEKGGAERNTFCAMEALREQGYDVYLGFGESFEESEKRKALDRGITTKKFPGLRNKFHFLNEFRVVKSIYRYLVSERIDVIHTHQTKASILGRIAAWMAGTPLVIYGIHGSTVSAHAQPLKALLYLLEYVTKFTTNHFVSVGQELREEFVNHNFCSYDNSTVIHSPIDLDKFYQAAERKKSLKEKYCRRFDVDPDRTIIGTVGRLNSSKGYEHIVELASRIVQEYDDAKFLFVGSGDENYEEKLRKLVRRKNLTQDVVFSGYQENVAEVMGIFDVFLFASLREGLPQVLVQAAACAVPIVTFEVNGAKEIVEDGESGYIVSKRDTEELSRKLSELIENPVKAKRMGLKGQSLVKGRWSPEKMKRETVELYDELIDQYGVTHNTL